MGVQGSAPDKLERSRSDEGNEQSEISESSQLAQGQSQFSHFNRGYHLPVGVFTGGIAWHHGFSNCTSGHIRGL